MDPGAYLAAAVKSAMKNRENILPPQEYAAQQEKWASGPFFGNDRLCDAIFIALGSERGHPIIGSKLLLGCCHGGGSH